MATDLTPPLGVSQQNTRMSGETDLSTLRPVSVRMAVEPYTCILFFLRRLRGLQRTIDGVLIEVPTPGKAVASTETAFQDFKPDVYDTSADCFVFCVLRNGERALAVVSLYSPYPVRP